MTVRDVDGDYSILRSDLPDDATTHGDGSVTIPASVLTRSRNTETTPMTNIRTAPNVVDVDELFALLGQSAPTGTAARAWPMLTRAAEHIVYDPTTSAQPAGSIVVGDTAWQGVLDTLFADRLDVVARFPLLVERTPTAEGRPRVPVLDFPTAGPQGGEKQELPSDAFVVAEADPFEIDAALVLNVSAQLARQTASTPGLVESFMALAVAAEAESQVVAAIESGATAVADLAAALASFIGVWRPRLLIAPASGVLGLGDDLRALEAIGVAVAFVPTATAFTLLDVNSVIGWLEPLRDAADEPALFGRQIARALFGAVAVSPAGAATFPAA